MILTKLAILDLVLKLPVRENELQVNESSRTPVVFLSQVTRDYESDPSNRATRLSDS